MILPSLSVLNGLKPGSRASSSIESTATFPRGPQLPETTQSVPELQSLASGTITVTTCPVRGMPCTAETIESTSPGWGATPLSLLSTHCCATCVPLLVGILKPAEMAARVNAMVEAAAQ